MVKNIDKESLNIDKKEVLRYLGHKGQAIDENTDSIVNECIDEVRKIIMPKAVYDYKNIQITDKGVEIEGSNLILTGNDIKNLLNESNECVLMAVTLGNDIERKTRLYERINLTKALILDSCATTAVEAACDNIEEIIKREVEEKGMSITFRYSPGYGDLPLNVQNNFLRVVNAEKLIGLNVSENDILFPRKSVTAIIGIVNKNIKKKKRDCSTCNNYANCSFRREGESCGA